MVLTNSIRAALRSASLLAALGAAIPAAAQYGNINPGLLSPRSEDKALKHRPDGWPAPVPGWTNGVRIIPGTGYYGGDTYIVIGGVPCYAPAYYGSGFFVNGWSPGIQTGPFGFGLNQGPLAPRWGTPGSPYQYGGYQADPPARPSDPPASSRSSSGTARRSSDDDDYYLNRPPTPAQRDPTLASAIEDIQQAFRTGDIASLTNHVDQSDTLVIASKGRTRKDISAAAYLAMTRDALSAMHTVRYTLDHVEPASNGAWLVYGTHILRGEDGSDKRFSVGFVLKKRNDRWMVAEVTADAAK